MRVLAISSPDDIPPGYTTISCGISGGTYEEYLFSMLAAYGQNLCLLLEPIKRRFLLPNYDGQGESIEKEEIEKLNFTPCFSHALCTNYFFIAQPPTVILFDNEFSLRQKAELAEQCGIPLLAADKALIKKLRLPD